MRSFPTLVFALLPATMVIGRAQAAIASLDPPPEIVEVPRGKLHLKAFLWKPAGPGPLPAVPFNHGSGVTADQTASLLIGEAAREIAPLFVAHGYAFLYLFRRGQVSRLPRRLSSRKSCNAKKRHTGRAAAASAIRFVDHRATR
jgi:hypothetical protein